MACGRLARRRGTAPGLVSQHGKESRRHLAVGMERFKVRAETLEGQERADALARIAAVSARYGKDQEKTDREIPIVRLTREP